MIPTVSVKDTRENIAELINQVDIAGKEFIITKFGKPKAMLVPVTGKGNRKRKGDKLPGFGAWANRKNIDNSIIWIDRIRNNWSKRNG